MLLCSRTRARLVDTVAGRTVVVYADTDGDGGMSGTADETAGLCANGFPVDGTIEAGHSETYGNDYGVLPVGDGPYLIADGDSSNSSYLQGYIGVSNYEYTDPDTEYSTDSGGRAGVNDTTVFAPFIVCGQLFGPDWDRSGDDGCVLVL